MAKKRNIVQFIKDITQEKCPNCKKGHVYKKSTSVFEIPEMTDECSECGYRFEREPGYFIGAMYLSYGLALTQGGITYLLLSLLLPSLSIGWIISAVILTFLLFAKKNFKWSRLLYIYIFPW